MNNDKSNCPEHAEGVKVMIVGDGDARQLSAFTSRGEVKVKHGKRILACAIPLLIKEMILNKE